MINDSQKNNKYQKLVDLYDKKDMNNLKKEIVNEMPKIIFNGDEFHPFESFKHVYSRFLEFKKYLCENQKDSLDNFDNKVIIVTHGDFLSVITNKYLYENDDINAFARDCCHCKNCDIISIYI
jgi:broad specificity phosphatase PhoE